MQGSHRYVQVTHSPGSWPLNKFSFCVYNSHAQFATGRSNLALDVKRFAVPIHSALKTSAAPVQPQWDALQQPQHMQSMPQHASYPPPDARSMSPGWGVPPPHMQAPPAGQASGVLIPLHPFTSHGHRQRMPVQVSSAFLCQCDMSLGCRCLILAHSDTCRPPSLLRADLYLSDVFRRVCTLGHAPWPRASSATSKHGPAATWRAPRSLQLPSAKSHAGSPSW